MNTVKHVNVAGIDCGSDDLFLICGPCVIEEESMMKTAERLKKISEKLELPLIFKSSFTKDNRSSLEYFQGPGLKEGLRILGRIKKEIGLPVLTDIHYPEHAAPAAEVLRRRGHQFRLPVHADGTRDGGRKNGRRRQPETRAIHCAR